MSTRNGRASERTFRGPGCVEPVRKGDLVPVPKDEDYVTFVSARWGALHRSAYLLTASSADADELLAETLTKAYVAWTKVTRADNPEAYLHRMLVNEFLSGRRRARSSRETLQTPPATAGKGHENATVERLAVQAALRALPPRQRAVLVLRYYRDCTEAQTADILGCAVGTVKSQTAAALKKLRTYLAAAAPTEADL